MTCRDRRVVEQAEAHRRRGLGVMARRSRRNECIRDLLSHHLIDRLACPARRTQHGLERARRHRGVGIEPHHAFLRRGLAHLLDVVHRMRERDHLQARHRRLLARERLEFLMLKRALDRAQTVRPLGMPHRHQVIEASGVAEQERGHAA